jgi:hypothetical protein
MVGLVVLAAVRLFMRVMVPEVLATHQRHHHKAGTERLLLQAKGIVAATGLMQVVQIMLLVVVVVLAELEQMLLLVLVVMEALQLHHPFLDHLFIMLAVGVELHKTLEELLV